MIGVNTFCLREAMAKNPAEVVRKLHEIGFDGIEPFVMTEKALSAIKTETDKFGMPILSVHVDLGGTKLIPPAWLLLKNMRSMHQTCGVDTFIFSGLFQDADGARNWAKLMKKLSEGMQPDGCKVIYHNHDYEVRPITVDGKTMSGLEYFLSLAGDSLLLQLDIGWAGMAGNEVAVVKQFAGKIYSLHLKDFYADSCGKYECRTIPQDRFCAIGEGEIKTQEILQLRTELSAFCGDIIIDQDNSMEDIMHDLDIGIRNVKQWL